MPEEYAKPLDAKSPSRYDADPTKQAFTGPYVFKSYDAGKKLVMTRNPNWQASTDFRPAYADRIDWTIGVDPNVAGRQILTGRGLTSGDTPPAPIIKLAATKYPKQAFFTPYGNRYITLNTQRKPFSNINVRRAVSAVVDKQALRQTRGGPLVGDLGTHVIPPTTPGFEEAGGAKGPGFDFISKPKGDRSLAVAYLKKAGFASGRYSGPPITVYGDNEDPAVKTAQVFLSELKSLGFGVKFRSFEHSVFLTKCTDTSVLRQVDGLHELRLAAGLRRRAVDAGSHVQRQRDHGHAHEQQQRLTAQRPEDQRRDGEGGAADGPGAAGQGVGQHRPLDHWHGGRRPVAVGQAAQRRVARRAGRDRAVERGLRPLVHLAQVARGPAVARYILRRFLWMIVLLFVVSAITFVIFYALPSADPRSCARRAVGHRRRRSSTSAPRWASTSRSTCSTSAT